MGKSRGIRENNENAEKFIHLTESLKFIDLKHFIVPNYTLNMLSFNFFHKLFHSEFASQFPG